jgi:hypothetical protein|tara:strand:+ start:464 stop:688 length:225 start_codon:yes stop_codon:yes gene_type:complete
MSKKITFDIDKNIFQLLELRFKDDEQGLNNFIIDAIRIHLKSTSLSEEKNNDLEDYLKKGLSGSRTYGIKGQGW